MRTYELLHWSPKVIVLLQFRLKRRRVFLQGLQLCFLIMCARHSRGYGLLPVMDKGPIAERRTTKREVLLAKLAVGLVLGRLKEGKWLA